MFSRRERESDREGGEGEWEGRRGNTEWERTDRERVERQRHEPNKQQVILFIL